MIHEPLRSSLYRKLADVLGEDEASALMNELPTVDWSSIVTRDHLDARFRAERVVSQDEFKAVRSEMHDEFKAVRGEMHHEFKAVRSEMHDEFTAVRGEMNDRFDAVTGRLDDLNGRMTQILMWMVGSIFAAVGLSFAAASLAH